MLIAATLLPASPTGMAAGWEERGCGLNRVRCGVVVYTDDRTGQRRVNKAALSAREHAN
jgi:hypothetical protein